MGNLIIYKLSKKNRYLEEIANLLVNNNSTFFGDFSKEKVTRRLEYEVNSKDYIHYIARVNKEPVGFLFVKIRMLNRDYELMVYVKSGQRKKGIASSLIKRAICDAKKNGEEEVCGYIDPTNEISKSLAKKMGFSIDDKIYPFRDGYRASMNL